MSETESITWHGTETLRPFLVPVETLQLHPHNPRRGNLPVIAQSLEAFGQVRPIVVRENVILAGNHTYKAAVELLGWTHIAVVDASHLQDSELDRFLVGDNRTSDLGGYNDEELSAILRRLHDEGKLHGTGYDADDVDDYLARMALLDEAERQEFQGDFLESPAEKEIREGQMRHAENLRDFTLIYEETQAVQFGIYIRMLKHHYSTTGIADTVYKAVEEAAKKL